jgi:drug/metabolite transporter (DMT)-like permease
MTRPRAGGSPAVFGQFLVLALTWGSSFLFIKVGLEGFSPAQVVLGRLVAGAAALLVVVAVTRQRLPRAAAVWGHLAVVAVLLCVVPFLLFAWAELHVSSGFASICNATTPLMTTMVAWVALPGERPDRIRLAGLIAGFAGVVVVLGPWRGLAGGGGRRRRRVCWRRSPTGWPSCICAGTSPRAGCRRSRWRPSRSASAR